ncbi:MAG: dephospho-CoA kinase [Firmicutes bacterium]|jgi:dephospho-CoA kinase|nr:dephospho-CoA kinase [Bacillota bacterium]
MLVLGLTGGIASGKSTVARMLASLGAEVIDADRLARDVVALGSEALAEIVKEFGPSVLNADGSLNRAALGRIVFADPARRKRLEEITHPRILEEMRRQLQVIKAQGEATLIVLDVPLLFETPEILPLCDCTAVVWVPEELQVHRLMQRDGLSRPDALQRIRAQIPLDRKRYLADVVIDNSGSLTATQSQVRSLWLRLVEKKCQTNDDD